MVSRACRQIVPECGPSGRTRFVLSCAFMICMHTYIHACVYVDVCTMCTQTLVFSSTHPCRSITLSTMNWNNVKLKVSASSHSVWWGQGCLQFSNFHNFRWLLIYIVIIVNDILMLHSNIQMTKLMNATDILCVSCNSLTVILWYVSPWGLSVCPKLMVT